MLSKGVWKNIKISSKEFNLENTLLNGQCFNWTKIKKNYFYGIFDQYYVEIYRIDDK